MKGPALWHNRIILAVAQDAPIRATFQPQLPTFASGKTEENGHDCCPLPPTWFFSFTQMDFQFLHCPGSFAAAVAIQRAKRSKWKIVSLPLCNSVFQINKYIFNKRKEKQPLIWATDYCVTETFYTYPVLMSWLCLINEFETKLTLKNRTYFVSCSTLNLASSEDEVTNVDITC